MIRRELFNWPLALGLALVMFVTRIGHFGEYGGPPDASWAVFFLAGLWLREPRLFPAFFALGWVADLVAFGLGTPTLCYSPAYLFLVPAYGLLWWAGHKAATMGGGWRIALALPVAAAGCFAVANLGMYLLAPPAAPTSLVAFASQVAGWFPGYLLTMAVYTAGAIALAAAVAAIRRPSATHGA
jgi:hypothetical protein